ncbi:MAG TPA: type I-D CRISPR-associated protein Cas7/Csc2, partial [Thermotogota bacterium]|nr:type I-D CRISPR-associated protein Cas7/Csc2 [Thermotogota bacterium]
TQELTRMGQKDATVANRIIWSKRKSIAPERRRGREFLRHYKISTKPCNINGGMCGECLDCTTYGFAGTDSDNKDVSGSLKSRVISENGFSILPASKVTGQRTFNALSENETMADMDDKGNLKQRQSINSNDYILPGTHFLDIESFHDLRPAEFLYALGNILRTARYGAINTRMGKVENEVFALVVADADIFSTLEMVQGVWDALSEKDHPLRADEVKKNALDQAKQLLEGEVGKTKLVSGPELQTLLDGLRDAYQDPENELVPFLKEVRSFK